MSLAALPTDSRLALGRLHGMAGSSTDPVGGSAHHPEDDPSLALALRLQEEDDAALALSLQEAEHASPPPPRPAPRPVPAASAPAPRAPLLTTPAHKVVQHLGRGTCKKIQEHFKCSSLSLRDVLQIFNSARREEMLMLVDSGQRQRVEAELIAMAIDFPM